MPILRTVLLALALATVPSLAAAAPGRPLGHIGGPLSGDGTQWIEWQGGGRTHVYDAATGETISYAAPDGCPFRAIGGGELLFVCPVAAGSLDPQLPLIVDLPGGDLHLPAAIERISVTALNAADQPSVVDIGRYGLAGWAPGFKGSFRFILSWRSAAPASHPVDAHHIVDLDDPGLVRPLCAPLGYKRRDATAYAPPWLIKSRGAREILIAHCGRTAQRTIRCAGYCGAASLGAGVLAWRDGAGVHALELRGGRRRTFAGYEQFAQAGRTLVIARKAPGPARVVRVF
jgi:hypothetical protein